MCGTQGDHILNHSRIKHFFKRPFARWDVVDESKELEVDDMEATFVRHSGDLFAQGRDI